MKELEIKLEGRTFKVSAQEEYAEKILSYAGNIKEKMKQIKQESGSVPFEPLLVLTCLAQQEELEQLKAAGAAVTNAPPEDQNHGQIQSLDQATIDKLNNINTYLESLAKRLG